MLERNRERGGRLGEDADLRRSALVTKVLPLLRKILSIDGGVFGKSAEFASFSSPTALTITRDPSDEQAGSFVHRLWSRSPRLRVLDILRTLTSADKPLSDVDDLSAVLIPLTEGTTPLRRDSEGLEPAQSTLTSVETCLRDAARDLAAYEENVLPNPMATLQRIVLLASISVFYHAATRAREAVQLPRRVLLLDASNAKRSSIIAEASEATVTALSADARAYMARTLRELLAATEGSRRGKKRWMDDPERAVSEMFKSHLRSKTPPHLKEVVDALEEIEAGGADVEEELPVRLVGILDSSGGRSLEGFIRLLGVRCGLLYPQQKNPHKRLVPMDRTLEVLVASTFDLSGPPLEFRDFLEEFYRRWGIVVGGRLEDARLLTAAGTPVPSAELTENAERFLTRLESLGLARKMADSVAVVGLMENTDGT
ncbi:hypothetical protein OV090_47805 [Nannocystis sp. RBIL2]|uniref:hypothetical protein n=1 Tax=Nannocystis sp. RBIL2 TaxID=2996788 RepID=UPI00226E0AD6|nr:hypothetical protein [Nannocystis sp. RBIL2]MCY1072545.1 hypothetical protein [Nannocystis sp. RBIL2]